MKRTNRVLSVLTAMLFATTLTFNIAADEPDEVDLPAEQEIVEPLEDGPANEGHTVSIENQTDHPYKAYQIFSGTQSEREPNLAGIKWGSGVDSGNVDALMSALQTDTRFVVEDENIFKDCKTAADVAEALGKYGNDSDVAKAFANVVKKKDPVGSGSEFHSVFRYLSESSAVDIAAGAESVEMGPGYYLLIDASTKSDLDKNKNDNNNSALLQVTDKITITKKYTIPTVNKSIVEEGPIESTDASIGDIIEFEIVGTLPSNYDDYDFYRYVFRDTMSHGLDLVGEYGIGKDGYDERYVTDGVTVKIEQDGGLESVDITRFATNNKNKADNKDYGMKIDIAFALDKDKIPLSNLTIWFSDLKKFEKLVNETLSEEGLSPIKLNSNTKFIITYQAKMTQFATIGNDGNLEQSNRVFLEYTRDPNDTSNPDDVKPTVNDVVEIYTFELDVAKVDSEDNQKTLPGAKFVLYRNNAGKQEYLQIGEKDDADLTHLEQVDSDRLYNFNIESKVKKWTTDAVEASVLESDENGAIKVIGLDSGIYYLEEIEAPDGYNKLTKPIEVEIKSELDQREDSPNLKSVSIKIDGVEYNPAVQPPLGVVHLDVGNSRGVVLPSTGGIGTALFYTAGTVLMIGAASVLIFKRRKDN